MPVVLTPYSELLTLASTRDHGHPAPRWAAEWPVGSPPPMDAEQPPADAGLADLESPDLDSPDGSAPVPSVVAVLVARGEAPHLELALAALRDTDYPDLTVLVIAATDTELRARVAAVMPSAFVRTTEARGFAQGANEALETVAGAPFLVFLHDDTICDPAALRLLVEEAYRSNAAIVGPKVVDVERREILREVGWSVDRFGVPHSDVERDELDQEQHDGVRDVFFVTSICMLVRADLFGELGGFDVDVDPGAAELDVCWRAQLAGARVLVAPDASVAHYEADPIADQDPNLVARHRVRAFLTSTSAVRLLWIAPVALLMHLVEAIVFVVRRRRGRAGTLVNAWVWNARHLGSLILARRRAQGARAVPDREISALQFRGSARVAAYMATSLHAEDRVRAISQRGRTVADSAGLRFRSVRGLVLVGLIAVALIGARDLLIGRVASVGQLAPWPGVGDLWRAFTSEWRYADLGSQVPAPPLLALVAGIRVMLLGAGELGRSLLIAGAIPAAIVGAQRLGRRVAGPGWPGAIAAIVYGLIPLPRTAIETGRFGPLMLYVAAPFVALAMFQLGGLISHRWPRRRIVVLGALATGLAAAAWPLAIAFPLVVALGIVVVAPFSSDGRSELGAVLRAVVLTTGVAAALLFPWPLSFLTGFDRSAALGISFDPTTSFGDLVRFVNGANGESIGSWAFVIVGLAVAALATGEKARWTIRWWGIALVAWGLAALPSWIGTEGPAVEGVLVPAALAMAMMAGIGVSSFLTDIRRHGLTWRQPLTVVASATLVLAALGFIGDAAGGRWHQPSSGWTENLSWMSSQRADGAFRVLWIGNPNVVPGDVHRAGDDGFALTNDGPGSLRDSLVPPGGDGLEATGKAIAALQSRTTTRFGRMVGPMAVRYIAVPSRPGPGGESAAPKRVGVLETTLAEQLDLRELNVEPGLRLFENVAWMASGSAAPTGTVLWSQEFSDGWRGSDRTGSLQHRRVFGWANGFSSPSGDPVTVTFGRQWWRWPMLVIELLVVAVVARQALRRGRRGRRARRAARSVEVAS